MTDFFDINDIDELSHVLETTTMATKHKKHGGHRPSPNRRPGHRHRGNRRRKGHGPRRTTPPPETVANLDLTERQEKEVQENM